MTPEQLEQLKADASAEGEYDKHDGQVYVEVRKRDVNDLIAEVERQAEHIANLEHDMDAAVEFCDEHHRWE